MSLLSQFALRLLFVSLVGVAIAFLAPDLTDLERSDLSLASLVGVVWSIILRLFARLMVNSAPIS